jgi:hypothetical protein
VNAVVSSRTTRACSSSNEPSGVISTPLADARKASGRAFLELPDVTAEHKDAVAGQPSKTA